MNTSRLANVIFDKGQKITQTQYQHICESLENDMFTLDEYVLGYKLKENFIGKVPYQLNDGTKVLVSKELIESINNLDINKDKLVEFMSSSIDNFKKTLSVIIEN